MNLSTAHFPQKPTSRTVGFAVVAAIHVVVFVAFSQGLMTQMIPKPDKPMVAKPFEETPPLPKPVPQYKPEQPKISQYTPTLVDPPVFQEPAPPPMGGIVTQVGDPAPQDLAQRGPVAPPAQTRPSDGIQSAGAVCTRIQKPDAPSVNWSGEALFSVVAGTHAGRVNQVEIRLLRGAMDGRTQRAFRSAIESAMREGYQCPGDVRFSQEFQFRVE